MGRENGAGGIAERDGAGSFREGTWKREEGHAEKTAWVKSKLTRDAGQGEALLCARPRARCCSVAAGQSMQATVWKSRRRLGIQGPQSSKALNLL